MNVKEYVLVARDVYTNLVEKRSKSDEIRESIPESILEIIPDVDKQDHANSPVNETIQQGLTHEFKTEDISQEPIKQYNLEKIKNKSILRKTIRQKKIKKTKTPVNANETAHMWMSYM